MPALSAAAELPAKRRTRDTAEHRLPPRRPAADRRAAGRAGDLDPPLARRPDVAAACDLSFDYRANDAEPAACRGRHGCNRFTRLCSRGTHSRILRQCRKSGKAPDPGSIHRVFQPPRLNRSVDGRSGCYGSGIGEEELPFGGRRAEHVARRGARRSWQREASGLRFACRYGHNRREPAEVGLVEGRQLRCATPHYRAAARRVVGIVTDGG